DAYRDRYRLLSSESASTTSSRGEYLLQRRDGSVGIVPARDHQVSAYDVYVTPWADHSEAMLWKLGTSPWIAGEFVWTGFDYIGEPTPFDWPSVLSYFGFIDLCGFPKDRFYLYQSRWTDRPMVHILPHWNWEGWSGAPIPVWCYTNADEVELFLDGRSLGVKTLKDTPRPRIEPDPKARTVHANRYQSPGVQSPQPLRFAWDVPWRPGVLKAEARRSGQVVATDEVRTAGPPERLVLEVDRPEIRAGGQDLAYVTVKVADRNGVVCPAADTSVRFELSGPADLAGVGNGDPISHADFQADRRRAWHGLALAVVRAGDQPGPVRLRARAEGLDDAEVTIRVH
ncbi:MAG TPA: DUF4982 domain-containing protein, partial [Isosphaeraceae bacterium]